MKNLMRLIIIVLVIIAWLFPCIIAVMKDNYWLILLYFVWWIPASLITGLLITIGDEI